MGRCSALEKYALKYHQNTSCYTIIFQTGKNETKEKSNEKVNFKPNSLKSLKMGVTDILQNLWETDAVRSRLRKLGQNIV